MCYPCLKQLKGATVYAILTKFWSVWIIFPIQWMASQSRDRAKAQGESWMVPYSENKKVKGERGVCLRCFIHMLPPYLWNNQVRWSHQYFMAAASLSSEEFSCRRGPFKSRWWGRVSRGSTGCFLVQQHVKEWITSPWTSTLRGNQYISTVDHMGYCYLTPWLEIEHIGIIFKCYLLLLTATPRPVSCQKFLWKSNSKVKKGNGTFT